MFLFQYGPGPRLATLLTKEFITGAFLYSLAEMKDQKNTKTSFDEIIDL